MRVNWPGVKCVACGSAEPLCVEHVLPAVIGGILHARIICRSCNSRIGTEIDAQLQRDDSLRGAVLALADRLPAHRHRMLEGMTAVAVSDGGPPVSGRIRRNQFKVGATQLADGSLVQSNADGLRAIHQILSRRGLDAKHVAEAVARAELAEFGQRVTVAPGLEVINWATQCIYPVPSGKVADARPFVKIALEFLSLSLGMSVYSEGVRMVWDSLFDTQALARLAELTLLQDAEYAGFHGIAIERNQPNVSIQVRLFGRLAYRVIFPRLAVNGPAYVYTHSLESGLDWLATV